MTNIAAERAMFARQGLTLRTREQWGATFDYRGARPVDLPATRVFLHIAVVTPTSMDATQRLIERIGISRFPSTGMSYNASVWKDGTPLEGQPLTRRGAHTVNDKDLRVCPNHGGLLTAPGSPMNLNVNARALVLPQGLNDPCTDAQVRGAAMWAAAQIRGGYMTPNVVWHGHRCVANKDCPGAKGYSRLPEIQQLTAEYVANGLPGGGNEDDMYDDAARTELITRIDQYNAITTQTLASMQFKLDQVNWGVNDPVDGVRTMVATLTDLTSVFSDAELQQIATAVADEIDRRASEPPTPS